MMAYGPNELGKRLKLLRLQSNASPDLFSEDNTLSEIDFFPIRTFSSNREVRSENPTFDLFRRTHSPISLPLKKDQDVKAAAFIKKSKEFLETLDKETTELLKKKCCDDKQTAQFWNYIVSKPCTSICEFPDISPDTWGGWFQSTFLLLYIRSLKETIIRTWKGEDQLLNNTRDISVIPMLDKELKIAVNTYESALERDRLELMIQQVEEAKIMRDKASKDQDRLNKKYQKLRDELQITMLDLDRDQYYLGLHEKDYKQEKKQFDDLIELFEIANNQLLTKPSLRASRAYVQNYNRSFQSLFGSGKQLQAENLKVKLQGLELARNEIVNKNKKIAELQEEMADYTHAIEQNNKSRIIAESDYVSAQANLKTLQASCAKNLLDKVNALLKDEHYCHAAGFKGHAIYVDFKNLGNAIQVKICNLGAGLKFHTMVPNTNLYLPLVIEFPKTTVGNQRLSEFCSNITLALSLEQKEAVKLIYENQSALSHEQHLELYNFGDLTGEKSQIISNCTAKGYLHSLRERLNERAQANDPNFFYRRLILSLFIWSKNAYAFRHYLDTNKIEDLPKDLSSLVSTQEIVHLKDSEAVMSPFTEHQLRYVLSSEYLPGLEFYPRAPLVAIQDYSSVQHRRTVSPAAN